MPSAVYRLSSPLALLLAACVLCIAVHARAEEPAPILLMDSAPPGSPEQAVEREQERLLRRHHLRLRHGARWPGAPPDATRRGAPQPAPRPSLRDAAAGAQLVAPLE